MFFLLSAYLSNKVGISNICKRFLRIWYKSDAESEIIINLKYNPPDKLAFEYGKILYYSNEINKAIDVFKGIAHKVNADWRCVYRSFILLYQIYIDLNDIAEMERYRKLYKAANPTLFERYHSVISSAKHEKQKKLCHD